MLLFFVYILYFVKRNDHFLELRYISAVIIIIIIVQCPATLARVSNFFHLLSFHIEENVLPQFKPEVC